MGRRQRRRGCRRVAYLSIRLALQQGHRVPALRLLTIGLTTVLVGDLAYASVDAGYLRADTAVLDAAYAFAFLCAGGAALHPTMRVLTEPQVVRERSLGAGRLAAVSTGLLAPVVAAAMRPPAAPWGRAGRDGDSTQQEAAEHVTWDDQTAGLLRSAPHLKIANRSQDRSTS